VLVTISNFLGEKRKTNSPIYLSRIMRLPYIATRSFGSLLFFLAVFQFGYSSEIINNCEQFIHSSYSKIDSISHNILELSPKIKNEIENKSKQRFFKSNLHYWNIVLNDSTQHIAILDNVIGKSMPITFLVIFNEKGKISTSQIIKYREPYGGEISSRNWLNQFINLNDSSSYNVGSGIDGISGATISVNSVSKGFHKLALLFPIINLKTIVD